MKTTNVLIVDDVPVLTDLMKAYVEMALGPCHVVVRYNLTDAITALDLNQFDLVVTDYQIPTGNEGAIISQTAKNRWLTTKVIVMSGQMASEEDAIRALSGADGYLAKPFKMEAAIEMITQVMVLNEKPVIA